MIFNKVKVYDREPNTAEAVFVYQIAILEQIIAIMRQDKRVKLCYNVIAIWNNGRL